MSNPHDIDPPKCVECGGETRFIGMNTGFVCRNSKCIVSTYYNKQKATAKNTKAKTRGRAR